MRSIRNAAICCLLYFSLHCDAARPPSQRLKNDAERPIYLPPSIPDFNTPQQTEDLHIRAFTLRHIYHHGAQEYPQLHRYMDVQDVNSFRMTDDFGATYQAPPKSLRARPSSWNIERLADRSDQHLDELLAYSRRHGRAAILPPSAWSIDPALGPNITDKETVLSFARMAQDAYVPKFGSGEWMEVGAGFNYTDDFGWEADGLRGHIFADETNATIVVALKGTSPAVFDGADTTGKDKLNDNLFGSCCCGQGGQSMWKQVCDCMTDTYTCNSTCLVTSLKQKSHYYTAVSELYSNVTERYPNSTIWVSGHSLGGVVGSLLGLTKGLPTLTFEAYPDAMAASRLDLPVPPRYKIGSHQSRSHLGIYHFGHTADPIFMGSCNGAFSFCSIAGYAFQGICHTGQTCVFDTVSDFGWRVGIGTHKIVNVIKDVIMKYDTMPSCTVDEDCQDCFNWKFFESNGTETTTSKIASSTKTRTRTETCKTPGWWGCLDESTTSASSTTSRPVSTTSSSSTSTCKTPGWFGCKDATTTTTSKSSSTASPRPSATTTALLPTTTCKTPGWFGCNDPTSTSSAASRSSSQTFMPSSVITPAPNRPSHGPSDALHWACVRRHWYGLCKKWQLVPDNDS